MKLKNLGLFTLILFITLSACKSNKNTTSTKSESSSTMSSGDSVPAIVRFLDATAASEAIIKDDTEGYFEKINKSDIQIQMKKNFENESIEEIRAEYVQFMKGQVSDWTTDEKLKMQELFTEVKRLCDGLSPRLYPGDMNLIKIKTDHFGRDVYYTRGHDILIPENIFENEDLSDQIPTLLHEVFHIISRYNVGLREDLYKMIGFYPAMMPVVLNELLEKMVMLNPDGMNLQYVMNLYDSKYYEFGLPLILVGSSVYDPKFPNYMDYMYHEFYVLGNYHDHYKILSNPQGLSVTGYDDTDEFFQNITDNTNYYIHPDEIMAENFKLAVLANTSKDYSKFSENGKALIDKVTARLKAF